MWRLLFLLVFKSDRGPNDEHCGPIVCLQATLRLLFFLLVSTAVTECQTQCGGDDCRCCAGDTCSGYGYCDWGCKPEYPECVVSSVVDDQCGMSDCKCCASNRCTSRGVCSDGCKPGYHGGRCRNKCPQNCTTCTDHPDAGQDRPDLNWIGYCTECKEGHYFTDDLYQCQSTCSSGCRTCLSGLNCTSCLPDLFPNLQIPGSCMLCPLECKLCDDSNGCLSCVSGFYHTVSQGQGRCVKCPDNCSTCESDVMCISCKNGHYGTNCELQCSNGCMMSCLKETGKCQCNANFAGEKCNACVSGNFGNNCTQSCSQNCQNTECDKLSGDCYVCIGNHVMPKCEKCINGYHGRNCETRCPNNCLNKTCDQSTGTCTLGCVGSFIGHKCEECITGKFGKECANDCPKRCITNKCTLESGYCTACISNFTGNTCEECINGLYGLECSLDCPPNCHGNRCDQHTGNCKTGCDSGFSGDKCGLQNSFCDKCSTHDECKACIDGRYGYICENNCPFTCKERKCNKNNGACHSCNDGFSGQFCNTLSYEKKNEDGNNTNVAIVGSVLSVAVVALAVALIVLYHRIRASSNNKANRSQDYYNLPKVGRDQRDTKENEMHDLKHENQQLRYEIDQLKTAVNMNFGAANEANTSLVYTILHHENKGENPYSQINTASPMIAGCIKHHSVNM